MAMNRASARIEQFPLLRGHPLVRLVFVVLISLAALAVRLELKDLLPPGYPFVTFFPAVIVSSFLFGRATGIFAGVLCGLLSWFFLIPPLGGFALDRASITAMAFYFGVVAVDILLIDRMQAANKRLLESREQGRILAEQSAKLAERSELLFQELQHRVGNNLQMVAAVLSLQLRSLDEPKARRAISDSVARIQVIGSIQRRLYRNNGELVPLDDFIREVCDQLMRSGGRPGVTYGIEAASGLVLPPEAAVPMALILAEALANALEHGFANREHGRIDIRLDQTPDAVTLTVRDNGAGLPQGFDAAQVDSLGLRISRTLGRQLSAEYQLEDNNPGCTMRLALPARLFTPHMS